MKLAECLKTIFVAVSLGVVVMLSAGCSSSDDDSSADAQNDSQTPGGMTDPGLPTDENPFAEADMNGTTVIARLGYPDARDQADELVSMSYLSLYYDLDSAIASLLQGTDQATDATVACPGGGSANGERSFFNFDVIFDQCIINGRTLSGGLARDANFSVFGLGSNQIVSLTFKELIVDAGDLGRLEVSGVSTRDDEDIAIIQCEASRITHNIDNQIVSARIESSGIVTTVSAADWQQSTITGPQATGADSSVECAMIESLNFDGKVSVGSSKFGDNEATIDKRGDIVRGAVEGGDSTARLGADFGDDSSLVVTATSDATREVQVDIVSDAVAVSFADTYRFEAREDIPPILGE